MKNSFHRSISWQPHFWVGGAAIIHVCCLEDDSLEKYAAIKANSAIYRAMKK